MRDSERRSICRNPGSVAAELPSFPGRSQRRFVLCLWRLSVTNSCFKLLQVCLVSCLALVLGSCGTRTEKELSSSSSPDKKLVASLVQVDPGGGATVGFVTDVYLHEVGRDSSGRKHSQFEGYSCGPVSIAWKDDQTLQITYRQHCHILAFDNEWWVGLNTDSARMVELVLIREEASNSP